MTRSNRKVQYMAGVCASLFFMFTGATFSWASPAIPKFKSGEANIIITDAQTSWVVSLLSLGALPGCYIGQLLIERIGRKWAILSSALPGVIGSLMMLFATSPPVMYAARLVLGLSIGIIAAATILYVTEIADKEVRGSLGMLVQVMYNFGSLIIYGIGPFVSYTSLNCIILAIPLLCTSLCLWIPESPYFYLKDGKIEMARKTFKILKGAKDEKWVDDQLGIIQANVRTNMENNKTSLKELLTNMKYRNALYIVAGLKVLQYMTGSLAIQSYLEMIFRQSSSISGPNASIFYGFVQLGAGIGATFLVRWFGRRTLMSISCLGVAMSLTAVGIYFYLQDAIRISPQVLQSISVLPLVGILSFNILYAIGNGNIPYIMQAELFPINVKSLASSLATMTACVFNFTIIKCYQGVKDSFGHYTVFWSFAFVGYVGVLFVYLYLPETKGKTLEEVQENMEEIAIEREALRSGD